MREGNKEEREGKTEKNSNKKANEKGGMVSTRTEEARRLETRKRT